MHFNWATFIVFSAALCGCGTLASRSSSKDDANLKIQELQSEIKKQSHQLETLRAKNLILSKKLKNYQKPTAEPPPIPFAEVQTPAVIDSKTPKVAVVEAVDADTSEHFLYSKVVQSYEQRDEASLRTALRLLSKTYPDSVHLDNSLYLLGLLNFEMQNWPSALRIFDEFLQKHPQGNKIVATLFAKAMTLKKLNRRESADRLLEQIASLYPGSPEAARVDIERQLLKRQAKKGDVP